MQVLKSVTDPKRPISYGIVQTGPRIHDGIRCIRVVDIENGRINDANLITTSEAISNAYKRTLLKENDLVIALRGKIGEVALIDKELIGANLTRGVALIATTADHVPDYIRHYLSSPTSRQILEKSLNGSALQEIAIATLRQIPAPLPHPSEQRRIAAVLSDVDGLISTLDHLIAKKRVIKLATMQQLLTGKTRLLGFSKERTSYSQIEGGKIQTDWEGVTLGELFAFKNGLNKAKEYFGFGTPIVNYMDVYGHSALYSADLMGRVSLSQAEISNFAVQKGDVFFTRTSETVDEIGVASVMLDESRDTVFSGFVLRARPRNARLDDQYKRYCFSTVEVRKQIISKSTYTTRALTNGRVLSAVSIPLPTLEEQKAIASVISGMDSEIAALERRRDKTKAIKQGMMQALLTGRIRLVKPGAQE